MYEVLLVNINSYIRIIVVGPIDSKSPFNAKVDRSFCNYSIVLFINNFFHLWNIK